MVKGIFVYHHTYPFQTTEFVMFPKDLKSPTRHYGVCSSLITQARLFARFFGLQVSFYASGPSPAQPHEQLTLGLPGLRFVLP